MKTSTKMAFSTILIIALIGCSKEKLIERNLHSKGGKWNIENMTVSMFEDVTLIGTESASDCGHFVFNKNGTGTYLYEVGTSTDNGSVSWSNTSDAVTINGEVYRIVSSDKNAKSTIKLKGKETEYYDGIAYAYEYTFTLKKDK